MTPEEQAQHDYKNVFLKVERRLSDLLSPQSEETWRILDIGCGYYYPSVVLFNGRVAGVCGVDIEWVFFRDGRWRTFRVRRHELGMLRGLKWALLRYSYYIRYYQELSALGNVTVQHDSLALHHYDGQHLPLESGRFDAVISNAVLEHVEDLDSFVKEVARVLRPGGVVDMCWHNFYAPSGGHQKARQVARSPWGHITGESKPPVYLNRVRPDEMCEIFRTHFDVLRVVPRDRLHRLMGEPGFEYEGQELLTLEWSAKLVGIPQELLTIRGYLIQCVKR